MREIIINKALNGYVVRVGCQTIVIEGDTRLLLELASYIGNPEGVEEEWLAKYGVSLNAPRPAEVNRAYDRKQVDPYDRGVPVGATTAPRGW